MAKEFTKEDLAKLDAKIGELTKRHDALHAAVDETHKAAQATKSEAASRSSEIRSLKQRRG